MKSETVKVKREGAVVASFDWQLAEVASELPNLGALNVTTFDGATKEDAGTPTPQADRPAFPNDGSAMENYSLTCTPGQMAGIIEACNRQKSTDTSNRLRVEMGEDSVEVRASRAIKDIRKAAKEGRPVDKAAAAAALQALLAEIGVEGE